MSGKQVDLLANVKDDPDFYNEQDLATKWARLIPKRPLRKAHRNLMNAADDLLPPPMKLAKIKNNEEEEGQGPVNANDQYEGLMYELCLDKWYELTEAMREPSGPFALFQKQYQGKIYDEMVQKGQRPDFADAVAEVRKQWLDLDDDRTKLYTDLHSKLREAFIKERNAVLNGEKLFSVEWYKDIPNLITGNWTDFGYGSYVTIDQEKEGKNSDEKLDSIEKCDKAINEADLKLTTIKNARRTLSTDARKAKQQKLDAEMAKKTLLEKEKANQPAETTKVAETVNGTDVVKGSEKEGEEEERSGDALSGIAEGNKANGGEGSEEDDDEDGSGEEDEDDLDIE